MHFVTFSPSEKPDFTLREISLSVAWPVLMFQLTWKNSKLVIPKCNIWAWNCVGSCSSFLSQNTAANACIHFMKCLVSNHNRWRSLTFYISNTPRSQLGGKAFELLNAAAQVTPSQGQWLSNINILNQSWPASTDPQLMLGAKAARQNWKLNLRCFDALWKLQNRHPSTVN